MKRIVPCMALIAIFFYCQNAAALSPPTLAVTTSELTVSLSWTAVQGAAGYTLSYAPYPYTGLASIHSIDMGMQTKLSVKLWDGAAFYVAINAYSGTEMSGYSSIKLVTVAATEGPWKLYDDFSGKSFDKEKWIVATGDQPEIIGGKLLFRGDQDIVVGTVTGVRGVQADLELSSKTDSFDSELQLGLDVIEQGNHVHNFRFELTSDNSPTVAKIQVAIDSETIDELITVSSALFDHAYRLGILINGDMLEFYINGEKIIEFDISTLDIENSGDMYFFVGCWADQEYNQTAEGYVDNVSIIEARTGDSPQIF